jgi:hypothetical protein
VNAIDFASAKRMTEAEYRLHRAEIRATHGDTATERTGSYDQVLATLFYCSGWTQEQLAGIESKSRQWIEKRVRFGRFLSVATAGAIPKNLTERRFRSYWERTDKTETNERIRFQAVQRLMADELTLSKNRSSTRNRELVTKILDRFGDGSWHRLKTIITQSEGLEADVVAVLTQMQTRGTYHTFCERRKGGSSFDYRIVRGRGRTVDVDVLLQKVSPIVQALQTEGRKHLAECSPGTIAMIAHDLKAILEQLTHESLLTSKRITKEKKQ